MIKILSTERRNTLHKRSFRRWVKQFFTSWISRQDHNHGGEIKQVFDELQEIKNSIEIIAREIVRRAKRGKK
jgi:hypothetical protein